MRRRFINLIFFLAIVVFVVAGLKFINWLPGLLERENMRRYSSIDEVKRKLTIREIYVPSYYPQEFRWPPSDILAQGSPYPLVIMEFRHAAAGDTGLVITQTGAGDFYRDRRISIVRVRERAVYDLKGRKAELEVGECEGKAQCSSIAWSEEGFKIYLAMKSGPFELIKIAESMLD